MRGAVVVVEGGGPRKSGPVADREEWQSVAELIRRRLVEAQEEGRCGAVTVSIHLADERCDHEVGW